MYGMPYEKPWPVRRVLAGLAAYLLLTGALMLGGNEPPADDPSYEARRAFIGGYEGGER